MKWSEGGLVAWEAHRPASAGTPRDEANTRLRQSEDPEEATALAGQTVEEGT